MIVFDLECRSGGHRFEGWFGSSEQFASQQARGLVTCPICGNGDVQKAVMAPNIARKGNQAAALPTSQPQSDAASVNTPVVTNNAPSLPPEADALFRSMAQAQAEALKTSRWVGDKFADTARAIHYGEREAEQVHGQATLRQAQELAEEGVTIAPVLFPLVPPGEAN